MAIDPAGALWIGVRSLVLRLSPGRDRFTETWIVRKDCRRDELIDAGGVCRGGRPSGLQTVRVRLVA